MRIETGETLETAKRSVPLHRKFGIRPGHRVALVSAPEGFVLTGLPDDVHVRTDLRGTKPLNVVLFFPENVRELRRRFGRMAARTHRNGGLWVAWPRKSSGVPTDLDHEAVQSAGLDVGRVGTRVCSVDGIHTAMRLSVPQRDRDPAVRRCNSGKVAPLVEARLIHPARVSRIKIRQVLDQVDCALVHSRTVMRYDRYTACFAAYYAALEASRAYMFARGFRPANDDKRGNTLAFIRATLGNHPCDIFEFFEHLDMKHHVSGDISRLEAFTCLTRAEIFARMIRHELRQAV